MVPLIARPGTALVGLIGRKRAGKDTLADELVALGGFVKAGFADPLRERALDINPVVGFEVEVFLGRGYEPEADVTPVLYAEALERYGYEEAKDRFPEFRRFLERYGTQGVRALEEDMWVRKALERVDARTTPYVLTDVRFPNEAEALRARGGVLVRVERPSLPPIPDDAHESETALLDYEVDLVLRNDGTLEAFQAVARSVARSLGSFRAYPR